MANATLSQTITVDQSLLKVAELLSRASLELKTLAKRVQRDPQQAWFWSEKWQAAEKEADEDIKMGRVVRLNTADDLDKPYEELFKNK